MQPPPLTVVFVHGAGHTGEVWDRTRVALGLASVAVDLPGRRGLPGDLTATTVDGAAAAIIEALAEVEGPVALVGHSVSGTVIPSVASALGPRVGHLVFVAGIVVPAGQRPMDYFLQPERRDAVAQALEDLRRRHAGDTLETAGERAASALDSLVLSAQPMRYGDLAPTTEVTYIRCRRDPIQTPALQELFAASSRRRSVR